MEKEIIKPSTAPLSLEVVIAERIFSLFRADGTEVQITARLGKPYKEKSLGDYRCPLQVIGWGMTAFTPLGATILLLHFNMPLTILGSF